VRLSNFAPKLLLSQFPVSYPVVANYSQKAVDTQLNMFVILAPFSIKNRISVSFHPNGFAFATGSEDKTARLFDIRSDQVSCYWR
jgi:WD40 repeat protein